MKKFNFEEHLPELCRLCAPPGVEDEVADFCRPFLEDGCDNVWTDEVGNLIGFIKGQSQKKEDSVRIFAHMDEISLIIKRIEDDGNIKVSPLGGIHPNIVGVGPVEILGRRETIKGVLSAGSVHVSEPLSGAFDIQAGMGNHAMQWHHVDLFTGLSKEDLYEKGVRAGTRVILPRDRRTFTALEDYYACYFFDDRAAISVLLQLISNLKEKNRRPHPDVYFVLTVEEEIGAHGAKFASRTIPATLTLGLEVGPAEDEYSVDFNASPVLVYRDEEAIYDRHVADHFLDLGEKIPMHIQTATFSTYKSDVSHAKSAGRSPFSGLLCLPTKNTHGYEVIHRSSIPNMVQLLDVFFEEDCSALLKRYSPEKAKLV